ncbi:enamine deaminase RidA (YjgF/YER057c/UK114 family) [Tamaricihabitans halophyticus]|uniref:Enamine deaminase RidA (YjgF/YER057c/UK114 family) n=1 Tax=Tamaricihabitans halophyticus TaxID=1262583 RepID=A0A4R2QKN0_9PSEU|nr:RidA family protein [Tamaricihabitans halophyticus]TCP50002.1 enamine deaminase RidA (YjgF/YER057c/UK114 family) [Tamaricihabitans halophyticus]
MTATNNCASRLAELGLSLPEPPATPPSFAPYSRDGQLVYSSGQIAVQDGQLIATGRLGAEIDVATGQEAARVCALSILAQLDAAAGSLDEVEQLLKVTVFVASTPDFTQQPQVANGASDLLTAVLGAAGEHARSAVGVAALPLGTPVEIEVIARLRTGASV